ncbi:MAG: DUF115 domain-containing protein [Lachnospiraceae bacterium]|nr:DUF115 domain-containing protein [Lachnospiraceae bacterium]
MEKREKDDNLIRLIREIRQEGKRLVRFACRQNFFAANGVLQRIIPCFAELFEKNCFDAPGMTDGKQEMERIIGLLLSAQQTGDYIAMADIMETDLIPLSDWLLDILNAKEAGEEEQEEVYRYNLGKLSVKDPALERLITTTQPEGSEYRILRSKSGTYTLTGTDELGRYHLHSANDPEWEAEEFANAYYHPNCKTYYVFGLGLGYHCKALSGLDEGARILIFENDPQIIRLAMKASKLDWLWENDRIKLIYDPKLEQFVKKLEEAGRMSDNTRNIMIIHHPSLRHIKELKLREAMEHLFIDDSTIRNQGKKLAANFRENIDLCKRSIEVVRNAFQGKKAIIVAGGPSLDLNIHLLKDLPEGYIILAVGTVFRKLMAQGIRPDYVIVTDPSNPIAHQFEGFWESDVPLLLMSTVYMGLTMRYKGPKYLLCQEGHEKAEELAATENLPLFLTGGSVTTTALDVCIRLGCSDIAFIGLDLAYTNDRSHATGTAAYTEVDSKGWQKERGYEWVKEGERWVIKEVEVPVSPIFQMYRKWMEKRVSDVGLKCRVYDATEGGAVKKGFTLIRLEDYLR